jgi:hypothetical protein
MPVQLRSPIRHRHEGGAEDLKFGARFIAGGVVTAGIGYALQGWPVTSAGLWVIAVLAVVFGVCVIFSDRD